MSRETFLPHGGGSFSSGSGSSRSGDSGDYSRRSSRRLSSDAYAVSSRSARDLAFSTRGGLNYTDSDEKKKKKSKLRDAMGDEDFLRGCETGLERRLARLDRMGVLRSATATATTNSSTNTPTESSRHRDVGLTSQRHDRDRDRERSRDRDYDRQPDPSASMTAALCRVASSGDVDGLEKLLRRMSTDDFDLLNARGADGKPPLLLAAGGGHLPLVRSLLTGRHRRQVDLNVQSSRDGRSALHVAAQHGQYEVVKFLLLQGSSASQRDNADRTPVAYAQRMDDASMVALLRVGELRRKLLEVSSRGDGERVAEVLKAGHSLVSGDSQRKIISIGRSIERRSSLVTSSSMRFATSLWEDAVDNALLLAASGGHIRSGSLLIGDNHARLGSNLWEDPVVLAARIPLDKLEIGEAMSRGAYGDVYRGWYRGELVAIKKLHPSMSRDMTHISAFLGEIKLMAAMDHPQIVRFVGVAWDALSEVCAVSELMAGGDLGAMLQDLRADGAPRGFRRHPIKLKLAVEVAHALTYLHSLDPPMLHRDLKSRNILLTADRRSAKLTDFGTTRETSDVTLTAGVGTSLWMAPEVIMGERYGVKADVFSLGVVLSELATHEIPYAHATERETGRPLPVAAVLHSVVSGTLDLDFAEQDDRDSENTKATSLTAAAAREVVKVARSCVRLEPSERPTAAQVACVLRRLLQAASLDEEP